MFNDVFVQANKPSSLEQCHAFSHASYLQGRAWGQNQSTQGVGIGGGVPLPYVRKKIKIWTKRWLLLQFLNLNTDFIVSKTKVKNSQNPIALVQDCYKIGILVM